jgi:formiminotetrahydrofolate cyclodeaminase
MSLGDLAQRLARRSAAPTAGTALAVTLALAAALVEMVAKYLPSGIAGAAGVASKARTLTARSFELAGEDADRIEHYLQLRRERSPEAADALGAAARTMSELVSLALELAEVAQYLMNAVASEVRSDAASALQLALATGEGALRLAEIDAVGITTAPTLRRLVEMRSALAQWSSTSTSDSPSATERQY